MVEKADDDHSRLEQELGSWPGSQTETHSSSSIVVELDLVYLHATIDVGVHVTLDAEVNSVAAFTLVDSGAMGVFMHVKFVEQCNAILQPKLVPRDVRVIDEWVISSELIPHETTIELIIGDH